MGRTYGLGKLGPLADGVARVSTFVHELQRERGISAVFLGSKGAQMRNELPGQRKSSDDQRQPALAIMAVLKATATGEFRGAIDAAEAAVGGLDARRKEVDAMSLTFGASSAYYTDTIAKLLTVTNEIAKVSGQGGVAMAISAYVNFVQGKERAGQERALGAGGIGQGRFELAAYSRMLGLVAAQDVYFNAFSAATTPELREFLARTVSGPAVDNVARMRDVIVKGGLEGEMSGLDSKTWFDAATSRIDLLKTVEDRIAADLSSLT